MECLNSKFCPFCKNLKAKDEFYKNRARSDGLCNRCKICDATHKKSPKIKTARKLWEAKNAEKLKAYHDKYNETYYPKNRDKYKESRDRWIKENPEKIKQIYKNSTAQRRAMKAGRTFPNLREEIKKIYELCPKGYHVDHIIPLKGKDVCGLHVPWNLQYLTPKENMIKGNKTIL